MAALQEAFSLKFEDTYLNSLRRADDEIKEYQAQRKKLESRRYVLHLHYLPRRRNNLGDSLTYDAAITKPTTAIPQSEDQTDSPASGTLHVLSSFWMLNER